VFLLQIKENHKQALQILNKQTSHEEEKDVSDDFKKELGETNKIQNYKTFLNVTRHECCHAALIYENRMNKHIFCIKMRKFV
jgi:formyltetrahydrofolate hydrolase